MFENFSFSGALVYYFGLRLTRYNFASLLVEKKQHDCYEKKREKSKRKIYRVLKKHSHKLDFKSKN